MEEINKRFEKIYTLTEKYINNNCKNRIDIKKYYSPDEECNIKNESTDKKRIFKQMVISLNNRASGKARMVDGFDSQNIEGVLYEYDYTKIAENYKDDDSGYKKLKEKLEDIGFAKSKNKRSVGKTEKYAHGIISAAHAFENGLIDHIRSSYDSEEDTDKLIKELQKIYNMGYALACDFLKECGYVDLVKPDTHIREICGELLKICYKMEISYSIVPTNESCKEIIKDIVKASKEDKLTCYQMDKMFWLIGSSDFYKNDDNVKMNGVKLRKKDFYKYVKDALNKK